MSKTLHISQSIRGALKNWSFPDGYEKIITGEDGKYLSPHHAREALMDALAEGKELLPMGDCEGFDHKTGCPGHENP